MPTYTFYTYAPSALAYDGVSAFDLAAGYDYTTDRLRIDVSDDDAVMNSGGDVNQTATVYDMDDNVVTSGVISVTAYAELDDGAGGFIYLDRIEVDGVHYGYVSSSPLTPGGNYPVTNSGTFEEDHTYYQTYSVPCFAPDTLISTQKGEVPVQWIKAGDKILTLDHGYQATAWVGRWRVPWDKLRRTQSHWPVTLAPAPDSGGRPLVVSASHRMLLSDMWFDLHLGSHEVLCRSGLISTPAAPVPGQGLTWHHILLPQHELIRANGQWTESLFAGGKVFSSLPQQVQDIALASCDGPHPYYARQPLRAHEARAYFAQTAPIRPKDRSDDTATRRNIRVA